MKIGKEIIQSYKYYFEFPYNQDVVEFCRSLKDKYGYGSFNWYDHSWRYSDVNITKDIQDKFPLVEITVEVKNDMGTVANKIENNVQLISELNEINKKKDSDINIIGINGDLRPFQKVAIEFINKAGGNIILSATMGSGKTVTSLAYAKYNNIKKILVIAPSSVKYSWEKEIKKFTDYSCLVIDSTSKFSQDWLKYNIIVVNYDILKKFLDVLCNMKFELGIADEAHYIKSITAQRFQFARKIFANIPQKLFLTGTPITNKIVDIWTSLHILDPLVFTNYYSFIRKYCRVSVNRFGGINIGDLKDADKLKYELSRYLFRREKEDILSDLPPESDIYITTKLNKEERNKYNAIQEEIKNLKAASQVTDDDNLAKAFDMKALGLLGNLCVLVANSKQDQVMEQIDNILASDEKIVVFSSYNEPLEKLKEIYGDTAVMLTAKTPEKQKGTVVTQFQEDPNVKIFLAGIRAAGVGITLTAANNAIYIEKNWSFADYIQSTARLSRLGQKADHVNIYHFIAEETIDEAIERTLKRKKQLSEKVISQNIPESEEDILEEI